jgi:DNA mismatch endonuclease, patch repair protein
MSAIRGRDTKPEMFVRKALHAAGFRYRLHVAELPGRPDVVLTRHKSIVLVHGCFWHHHGCANSVWPKTRAAFWRKKIKGNVVRDRNNRTRLVALGWRVFTVWECDLRAGGSLAPLLAAIGRKRSKSR